MKPSVFITPAPSFKEKEIKKIISSKFGISGSVKHLYGDRDQNFHVETHDRSYILKVFNAQEDENIIDLQDKAINHIKEKQSSILVPSSLYHKKIKYNGTTYNFKIMKFLEGEFIYKTKMTISDYIDMGTFMGIFSTTLIGFNHKAAHRSFDWDCSQISIIRKNLFFVQNQNKRKTILHFLNQYEKKVTPFLKKLKMSVIHNDANDHNILKNQKLQCFGIIDFGDMVYSYQVIEPAVAIAYIYLSNDDPLEKICAFLKGYHSSFGLENLEYKVIIYFMCMRICLTATMSAWRKELFPKNEYLSISEKPAWKALNKLSKANLSELSSEIFKNAKEK